MRGLRRPAQLTPENAAAFQLPGVVAAYHLRTPYPKELAPFLLALARPPGGTVLELGCGTGEIARGLAPQSARVDAIDISLPMLDRARSMPGGDHAAIRWIHAPGEEAPMEAPYALAVAGDSLHWMDWEVTLRRVAEALLPGAPMAIVSAIAEAQPWDDALLDVIKRYSVLRDFEAYDFIEELLIRRLFDWLGDLSVGAESFTRRVDDYIAALHATAGLPAEPMGGAAARAFDAEVRRLVQPHARRGMLHLGATARVVWGRPLIDASRD